MLPKDEWLAADALRTANAPPAVFGLTRAALNALIAAAHGSGHWDGDGVWPSVGEDGVRGRMRERAYALVDDVAPDEAVEERVAAAGAVTKLAQDVTSALVAVQAGRAMLLSSPEQRWAREALFALVQARQVTASARPTRARPLQCGTPALSAVSSARHASPAHEGADAVERQARVSGSRCVPSSSRRRRAR